jgi:hypothetical protein
MRHIFEIGFFALALLAIGSIIDWGPDEDEEDIKGTWPNGLPPNPPEIVLQRCWEGRDKCWWPVRHVCSGGLFQWEQTSCTRPTQALVFER